MTSDQPIRVRLPHRHGGLWWLAVLLGVVGAVVTYGITLRLATWLDRMTVPTALSARLIDLVRGIGPLVVPMLYALYLARCCQHVRALAVMGMTTVGVQLCGVLLLLSFLDGMPAPGAVAYFAIVGFGVLGAVGTAGIGVFYRTFFTVQIDQDGTMCAGCGYAITGLSGPCCPECGLSLEAPTSPPGGRVYRFAERLRASRVRQAAIVLLLVAGPAAVVWQRVPLWRCERRFAAHAVKAVRFFTGTRVTPFARSTVVPHPTRSDRALSLVVFRPRPAAPIQAEAVLTSVTNGAAAEGSIKVRVTFEPPAARALLADGVPPQLWDRILARAEAAGWDPGAAPTGQVVSVRMEEINRSAAQD